MLLRACVSERVHTCAEAVCPSEESDYFDGDLCSPRWKSRRRSLSPLRGIVGRNFIGACKYICPRGRVVRQIFGITVDLNRPFRARVYPTGARGVARLLIARLCFVVETIKFRTRANERECKIACARARASNEHKKKTRREKKDLKFCVESKRGINAIRARDIMRFVIGASARDPSSLGSLLPTD